MKLQSKKSLHITKNSWIIFTYKIEHWLSWQHKDNFSFEYVILTATTKKTWSDKMKVQVKDIYLENEGLCTTLMSSI